MSQNFNHNPFNIIRLLWLDDPEVANHLNRVFEIGLSKLNLEIRSWCGSLAKLEEIGLYKPENYIDSLSNFLLESPKAIHFAELLNARDIYSVSVFGNQLALTMSSFVLEYNETNNFIEFSPIFGYITGHWKAENSPTAQDEGTIFTVTTGGSRTKFTQMLFDKAQDIEIIVSCIADRLDIMDQEFLDNSRIISIEELRNRKQMLDIIPLHPDQCCDLYSHNCSFLGSKSQFMLDGHMVGSDHFNRHWDYKHIALRNIKTFAKNEFKIFVEGLDDSSRDFIYDNRFYDIFTRDESIADVKITISENLHSKENFQDEACIAMGALWAFQGVDFDCAMYKVAVNEKVKTTLNTDK